MFVPDLLLIPLHSAFPHRDHLTRMNTRGALWFRLFTYQLILETIR